mmetsp:Transcript_7500/g.19692  ORF Transcript_7500/g.19692 Transcript_7500/m.19692 type:complete len:212 (-) Transcript_7500:390-1025(-)
MSLGRRARSTTCLRAACKRPSRKVVCIFLGRFRCLLHGWTMCARSPSIQQRAHRTHWRRCTSCSTLVLDCTPASSHDGVLNHAAQPYAPAVTSIGTSATHSTASGCPMLSTRSFAHCRLLLPVRTLSMRLIFGHAGHVDHLGTRKNLKLQTWMNSLRLSQGPAPLSVFARVEAISADTLASRPPFLSRILLCALTWQHTALLSWALETDRV